MRRLGLIRRIFLSLLVIYLSVSLIAGIGLAELNLHPPRLHLLPAARLIAATEAKNKTRVEDVNIRALDNATLRGWYARPARDNGNVVVLLHGVADNREGVAGYAQIFLSHGYRVLLPDSRAHGESGGALATYGLLEADDIHRWVTWLYAHDAPHCVFGLGESMGAALLLQSLAAEPRFCAVVAESSFSTFRSEAYDRTGFFIGLGPWFGRSLGRLPIEVALLYTWLRYHLDFTHANPQDAVASSRVPVLLIHGMNDRNILPSHSQQLATVGANHAELWLVPHADHTGAWSTAPEQFETRVLEWFRTHD